MARRARNEILYDGCFAHIFSRAMGKQFVFEGERDFQFFKSLLFRTKAKQGYQLHHYCLMNTHFHLAVSIPNVKAFSSALKEIKQRYAAHVVKTRSWQGPLWWGRFRSQLIEDETYLHACGLYIERNPVQAGIVKKPEDWPHSSSRHYLLGEQDSLIDPYEPPSFEKSQEILKNLDLDTSGVIGSELFQLHLKEGILQD